MNFLARNPQIRPRIDISRNDPMFDAIRNARNNAETLLHSLGIGGGLGAQSQCITKNITTPPTYMLETCHSYPQIADTTCTTTKQFVTNCAGAINITPTYSTQPISTPATTTNVSSPASLVSQQSCTTMCTVNSCTNSWVPSPSAVCSSYTSRRNSIILEYQTVLGRCADAGGLDHFDSLGWSIDAIRAALMGSPERTDWQNAGFPTIRSMAGFCGANTFQNPNLCLTSSCTWSTYEASSCSYNSAGLICSGTAVENAIIGYYTTHLGRCADAVGLSHHVNLYNSGVTLSSIDNSIRNSSEAVYYASSGRPYERPASNICGIDGKLFGTNTCKTCGCSSGSTSQSCTTTHFYQCPLGSTLSGSTCLTPTLTCPSGSQLNGSTCTSTQHVYTCPDTTALNGGQHSGTSLPVYFATTQPLVCASVDAIEAGLITSYRNCLGRCADYPGLNLWKTRIRDGYETASSASAGICNSPEALEWNRLGKPTIRKIPTLCDSDKHFENFDKCRRVNLTYTASSQIANPTCSGTVDYVDIGQGCAPGTAATKVVGSTQTSNCATNSGQCVTNSSTCTPGATVVNGLSVSDPCITKTDNNTCLTSRTIDDCEDMRNSECTPQSSRCTETDETGQCSLTEHTYQCVSSKGSTKQIQDCGNQQHNLKDFTFDTGYEPDSDFARSMALMEAAREAGVYGSETSIFSGTDSRCKIKLSGLKNCCKKSGGGAGMSNAITIGTAVKAGALTYQYGSRYMYDALYGQGAIAQGLNAMSGGIFAGAYESYGASMFTLNAVSLYGFTVTGAPLTGAALSAAGTGIGTAGGMHFYFDPYSFALTIGLMILQEILSCDQSEQILAMRRGQNLCREVGSYCSKRVLRVCVERTNSYCCYNSRLARIINEQGRGQIGKSWGSPASPNCSGFTPAEFAAIDFSRMDMSEFVAEIMANIKLPDVGSMSQNVQGVVQQKMQNYYQRGGQ